MRSSRLARGGLLASALLSILAAANAGGAQAADQTIKPIDAGHTESLALNGTATVASDRGRHRRIELTNGSAVYDGTVHAPLS
ncbi:hypothetical protein AB0F72_01360 [Actinoplanes sp. NPDC023936]|uniref:hypothetical protein n=1 Tax=Actinoplanes sp. NPDC023936 TaxID=3154910 RepID=UPI0033F07BE9